jgi:L-ascorbate metabolism protein UlaG (beta-lactamase superfamily)
MSIAGRAAGSAGSALPVPPAGSPAATARDGTPAPAAPDDPPPLRIPAIRVRFLGHATVVLDLPGFRLVTDPFLRASLGPLRRHGPLPRPGAIGPVGFVAISHAHPDHFDPASLRALAGDPLVIVPRGLGATVRRNGLRAHEVVVGEQVSIAPHWTVTAVPARHWRWPGALRAATIGYLIEGPNGAGIYFAGDTGPFQAMADLKGRVDLALLPVGSWGPHLSPGHLSPRTAAEVARRIGARVAIPIHWGTLYPRSLDRFLGAGLTEPATQFGEWAGRLVPGLDVRVLQPGEATTVER